MFFEDAALEPSTLALLRRLGDVLAPQEFLLVGGTALAIQLGHRRSIDLDFFTRKSFSPDELLDKLTRASLGAIVLNARAEHTLNLTVANVKIDLIRYDYPLIEPPLRADQYQMLAIPDIAAMKLAAVTNRGSKKDFVDLSFLLDRYEMSELLSFYKRKFPNHDTFFVLRSLTYFDDAELEPDPIMIDPREWTTAKDAIISAIRSMS